MMLNKQNADQQCQTRGAQNNNDVEHEEQQSSNVEQKEK
jgi:hypothetical protein